MVFTNKNYSDPAVQALQYLDAIHSKDPKDKAQFFRTTLTEVFPVIPRVRKIMYLTFTPMLFKNNPPNNLFNNYLFFINPFF